MHLLSQIKKLQDVRIDPLQKASISTFNSPPEVALPLCPSLLVPADFNCVHVSIKRHLLPSITLILKTKCGLQSAALQTTVLGIQKQHTANA